MLSYVTFTIDLHKAFFFVDAGGAKILVHGGQGYKIEIKKNWLKILNKLALIILFFILNHDGLCCGEEEGNMILSILDQVISSLSYEAFEKGIMWE